MLSIPYTLICLSFVVNLFNQWGIVKVLFFIIKFRKITQLFYLLSYLLVDTFSICGDFYLDACNEKLCYNLII